jgi:hypothetical protein
MATTLAGLHNRGRLASETKQKPLRSETAGLVGAHGVRLHSRYLQYRFVSSFWWLLNDPRRLLGQQRRFLKPDVSRYVRAVTDHEPQRGGL